MIKWIRTDDIEALGALCSFLMDQKQVARVNPALTLGDTAGFVTRYLERCFRENPDGDWSDSRYGAARALVAWFVVLWKDKGIDRKELAWLKGWMAKVYRDGDRDIRRCIVDGALEHLFEDREIASFFADWNEDPTLTIACAEASEWASSRPMRGGPIN